MKKKRLTERAVIRWALKVLADNIYAGYGIERKPSPEDQKYLDKIEKMLSKFGR